ncbi:MAG: hypothetical protein AVDCRST_MAG89-1427, partial [uncultured Gemmatimonadetes bacterium]
REPAPPGRGLGRRHAPHGPGQRHPLRRRSAVSAFLAIDAAAVCECAADGAV